MVRALTRASGDGARREFEAFFVDVEPRLRRALVARYGPEDAADAVAEALTWAWAHWHRMRVMENAVGYLYRVAQSAHRERRQGFLALLAAEDGPHVEPGLLPALIALPDRQRTAVWLVVASHFTQKEAAEAMGVSRSAVATHVERGLNALRSGLHAAAAEG
ncbi:MAG: sigma factor-like helix-turn-helix DNA-binding protein [Actinomycetota bacterium]